MNPRPPRSNNLHPIKLLPKTFSHTLRIPLLETNLLCWTLNHLSPTPNRLFSLNSLKQAQPQLQKNSSSQKSEMATKVKLSNLVLLSSFLIITILSSQPSLASEPPNRPSSKWDPRFLGRFSQQPKQLQQYQYETRYFMQRLDHFSFSDQPKFPQRYLINTENWVGPQRLGPIFLYCGNEGDIEWFAANTGFVWEIAPRFGAMVVFPEVIKFSNFILFFR